MTDIKTLTKTFCEYSTFIRGYSSRTILRYKFVINLYCKFSGAIDIKDATNNSVRSFFLNGRIDRAWRPNSFVTYLKSLVVFFRWCEKEGYLTSNPALDIESPKMEKRLPPKLTKQQAIFILEIAYNYPYKSKFLRYRNHAIFSVFIYAGLRKSELLNLKYADVDIENMSIFVRQGKGAKDRIVPICSSLKDVLEKYLAERFRLGKTCPNFFTSLPENRGLTEISLKRLVDHVKESSKIPFSIHKLRHTFATLMLEGGCDIFSLSKMMGHSDIKTTTIYLAASAEHLRAQMSKHPLNNF